MTGQRMLYWFIGAMLIVLLTMAVQLALSMRDRRRHETPLQRSRDTRKMTILLIGALFLPVVMMAVSKMR